MSRATIGQAGRYQQHPSQTTHPLGIAGIAILLCSAPSLYACGTGDTERWDVKVLKDAKVSKINWSPEESSVSELVALVHSSGSAGRAPAEARTVRVRGLAIGIQTQPDGDFHLVIADPDDHKKTMITEAPDPDCVMPDFSEHIQAVRTAIERDLGTPVPEYRRLNHPLSVEVTGVLFFDFPHGEHGQAANGVELHPLLELHVDQVQRVARLGKRPGK